MKAFRKNGVQIAVLSSYLNFIYPNVNLRRAGIELFQEFVRFARHFSCGIVATETGSVLSDYSYHPKNHGEEAFAVVLETVRELVDEAQILGELDFGDIAENVRCLKDICSQVSTP